MHAVNISNCQSVLLIAPPFSRMWVVNVARTKCTAFCEPLLWLDKALSALWRALAREGGVLSLEQDIVELGNMLSPKLCTRAEH